MSYRNTFWVRRRDNAYIRIDGDSDSSGMSSRSLLAVNVGTGRRFWVTPEGLSRKYARVTRPPRLAEQENQ